MPTKPLTSNGKPIVTPSTIEPGDVVTFGGGAPVTVIDVARTPGRNGGHHATVWFDQDLANGFGNRLDLKPGHYLDFIDHKPGVSAVGPDTVLGE